PLMIGVPIGTTAKNGVESRARKSPAGAVSWIVRVSPLAEIPETWEECPPWNAFAPTMSPTSPNAGAAAPSFPATPRSIVYVKAAAVTGSFEGGENLNPGRIRNGYVLPPFETFGIAAATSGRSWVPCAKPASG